MTRAAATQRGKTRKHNFAVYYNSTRVNGILLSKSQTAHAPVFRFNPKKGKLYTIIMYDLYSPQPKYLHYMAVNITSTTDIAAIVPYQPPSPPIKDTHYHVYIFELYEQSGFLTISAPSVRSGFNPDAFAREHSLRKIGQQGFYVIPSQD